MTKYIFAFAIFISPFFASAEVPSKYRLECALTSKELKENLPSNFTSVWCADDKRKDIGEMGPDIVHAMVVAAFYEKRMDRRMAGMTLLERYNCKNQEECKEFFNLLDWGIKSGRPERYNKPLTKRANTLRDKVTEQLKSL